MLTEIVPLTPPPLPATSHILNQPIVGIASPAGDTGKTDRGATADVAPAESPWRKWLGLAEALSGRSLADDRDAHAAFQEGIAPDEYVPPLGGAA